MPAVKRLFACFRLSAAAEEASSQKHLMCGCKLDTLPWIAPAASCFSTLLSTLCSLLATLAIQNVP